MALVQNDSMAGNEFLRSKAVNIDINDPVAHYLAERMLETVKKAPGVGIAAPQVGISRNLVIVQRMDKSEKPFEIYFNPVITEFSTEKATGWEGCLSVPAGFCKVPRSKFVVVEYDTKDRGRVSEKIEGYTAIIFQHELDHLNGVLFIDKKEPGDLMPKEQYYEMRKKEKEKESQKTDQK